jgi:hypothetical protein
MEDSPKTAFVIKRTSPPSDIDKFDRGTVCVTRVNTEDDFSIYLQMSHQEETPNWVLCGEYSCNAYIVKRIAEAAKRLQDF